MFGLSTVHIQGEPNQETTRNQIRQPSRMVSTDITALKHAEQAAEEAKARLADWLAHQAKRCSRHLAFFT